MLHLPIHIHMRTRVRVRARLRVCTVTRTRVHAGTQAQHANACGTGRTSVRHRAHRGARALAMVFYALLRQSFLSHRRLLRRDLRRGSSAMGRRWRRSSAARRMRAQTRLTSPLDVEEHAVHEQALAGAVFADDGGQGDRRLERLQKLLRLLREAKR